MSKKQTLPRLQEVLRVCEQRVVPYIMSCLTPLATVRLLGVSKDIRRIVSLELQDAGYDAGRWARVVASKALATDEPMYMQLLQFVSYFLAEKRLDMNQKRLLCIYMKGAFTYYDEDYRGYGLMARPPLIPENSVFKSHRTHFKSALVCLSDTLNLERESAFKPVSVYVPQMREFARNMDRLLMEQKDVLGTFKEELVRAFQFGAFGRRLENYMRAICHLPHLLLKLFRLFLGY